MNSVVLRENNEVELYIQSGKVLNNKNNNNNNEKKKPQRGLGGNFPQKF